MSRSNMVSVLLFSDYYFYSAHSIDPRMEAQFKLVSSQKGIYWLTYT